MYFKDTEQSPAVLLATLKAARELLDFCKPFLHPDHVERLPEEKLGEVADYTTLIREACQKLCRAMNLQIAKNRRAATAARKKETPQGCTEPAAAEPERWVEDSWIAECEAAGVYSNERPVFRYAEEPAAAVMLTQSELQLLAQRHLNTVLWHLEYTRWTGDKGERSRKYLHESRFWQLFEQLTPEVKERFQRQIDIRMQYIESVEAEVRRRGKEEAAFWDAVREGMVSEAQIAVHVSPPQVGGLYDHEQWSIFGVENETSSPDSNEVLSGEAS